MKYLHDSHTAPGVIERWCHEDRPDDGDKSMSDRLHALRCLPGAVTTSPGGTCDAASVTFPSLYLVTQTSDHYPGQRIGPLPYAVGFCMERGFASWLVNTWYAKNNRGSVTSNDDRWGYNFHTFTRNLTFLPWTPERWEDSLVSELISLQTWLRHMTYAGHHDDSRHRDLWYEWKNQPVQAAAPPAPPPPPPLYGGGWVYLIREGEAGNIKIGWAADPDKRLKDLQTGNSSPLRIAAKMPGSRGVERALHSMFSRHRTQGEWFTPSPELLSYIAAMKGVASA